MPGYGQPQGDGLFYGERPAINPEDMPDMDENGNPRVCVFVVMVVVVVSQCGCGCGRACGSMVRCFNHNVPNHKAIVPAARQPWGVWGGCLCVKLAAVSWHQRSLRLCWFALAGTVHGCLRVVWVLHTRRQGLRRWTWTSRHRMEGPAAGQWCVRAWELGSGMDRQGCLGEESAGAVRRPLSEILNASAAAQGWPRTSPPKYVNTGAGMLHHCRQQPCALVLIIYLHHH